MPNWCKNNLRIKDNGEKVLELLEYVKDENGHFTMNKAVPMPEELKTTSSPVRDTVPDEERKRLIEMYGADNWYDWSCKNWGVKWDANDSGFWKDGEDWIISFSTPWGPPCEFMKKLSAQFPKMTFILQFADEGIGSYPLGQCTYENGLECIEGPEEGTDDAETFANSVWDEEWVNDYD